MKRFIHELRCAIAEWLFSLPLWVVPKDCKEEYLMVRAVKFYFEEVQVFMDYQDERER